MVHLPINQVSEYYEWFPAKAPSPSQPPFSFASGPFTGNLDEYFFVSRGFDESRSEAGITRSRVITLKSPAV
jgi:hypothetical protein